jgi:DNA-binding MarR family transcriptional regulator
MVRPPLALVLLRASRWFDAQLLERLAGRGWPRLTPAQSLVFAHLSEDGTSPSELARRLGSSRQAAHELVAGLEALALLEVVEDPARRRGRLVTLTPDGHRLADDARHVLAELEDQLGRDRVDALHELLEGLGRAAGAAASSGLVPEVSPPR